MRHGRSTRCGFSVWIPAARFAVTLKMAFRIRKDAVVEKLECFGKLNDVHHEGLKGFTVMNEERIRIIFYTRLEILLTHMQHFELNSHFWLSFRSQNRLLRWRIMWYETYIFWIVIGRSSRSYQYAIPSHMGVQSVQSSHYFGLYRLWNQIVLETLVIQTVVGGNIVQNIKDEEQLTQPASTQILRYSGGLIMVETRFFMESCLIHPLTSMAYLSFARRKIRIDEASVL